MMGSPAQVLECSQILRNLLLEIADALLAASEWQFNVALISFQSCIRSRSWRGKYERQMNEPPRCWQQFAVKPCLVQRKTPLSC